MSTKPISFVLWSFWLFGGAVATNNEIGKHFQSFLLRWSLLMKSFSQRAALKLTRFAKQLEGLEVIY